MSRIVSAPSSWRHRCRYCRHYSQIRGCLRFLDRMPNTVESVCSIIYWKGWIRSVWPEVRPFEKLFKYLRSQCVLSRYYPSYDIRVYIIPYTFSITFYLIPIS